MIVDTNVIIDAIGPSTPHSDASAEALASAAADGDLSINLIIFAEISARFASAGEVEATLSGLNLKIAPLTAAIAHRAGVAYRDYRRSGGPRESILADFFIGAHAELTHQPIMTRDPRRFASYFPAVTLVDPQKDYDD